jgi:fatty acid desaturase
MALEILRDDRLGDVKWKDLMHLSRGEVVYEVLLSLPWLGLSLILAQLAISLDFWPLFAPALGCSFVFFLCGLRQVHNAFHYAVGISPRAHEWLMFTLSVVMLSAMHAVKWNHLRHHRHCMDDEDVEAMSARMPGWKAILVGPYFPFMIHKTALQLGKPAVRRWVLFELLGIAIFVSLVAVFATPVLLYHVIAMTIGQCLSGFFAVWTVHHDCDRSHYIARTIRNPYKAFVTYNMFYHVEHHLFPSVPTCHLPELAKRLDGVAPELKSKLVF